jgi:ribosomal protein S18 acetylase RimI-like enzyme
MLRNFILIFLLYSCAPGSTESPVLTLGVIQNFNQHSDNFDTILNLRNDCFGTKNPSGLLGNKIFVGVKNNMIIGYFSYHLQNNNTEAFIHDVCVASSFIGAGVGTKFFNLGLADLESIPSIKALELNVHTDNEAALRLYTSAGFKILYTFKEDSQKLYRMRKNI